MVGLKSIKRRLKKRTSSQHTKKASSKGDSSLKDKSAKAKKEAQLQEIEKKKTMAEEVSNSATVNGLNVKKSLRKKQALSDERRIKTIVSGVTTGMSASAKFNKEEKRKNTRKETTTNNIEQYGKTIGGIIGKTEVDKEKGKYVTTENGDIVPGLASNTIREVATKTGVKSVVATKADEFVTKDGMDLSEVAGNVKLGADTVSVVGKITKTLKKKKVDKPDVKSNTILSKVTKGFKKITGSSLFKVVKEALNLGSAVLSIVTGILGAKSKMAQWKVLKKLVIDPKTKKAKSDAHPEAKYALGKIPRGFIRMIKNIFKGIVSLVYNISKYIPGAHIVTAALKTFQSVTKIIGSIYSVSKRWYQKFKGEKKIQNSKSLVDKAIKGDKVSLQLILDLKLGSIAGTNYKHVDKVLSGGNKVIEKSKNLIKAPKTRKLHGEEAERIIDKTGHGKGGPKTTEELKTLLNTLGQKSIDKIVDNVKETMTGFGT